MPQLLPVITADIVRMGARRQAFCWLYTFAIHLATKLAVWNPNFPPVKAGSIEQLS